MFKLRQTTKNAIPGPKVVVCVYLIQVVCVSDCSALAHEVSFHEFGDVSVKDGVFYTVSSSGAYSTIVPPAGALVTSLPDDYEVIVMNGIEYFLVDNTVYRTTVFDSQPYLEVLGQMYGSLYGQYNIYRYSF